MTDVVKNVPDDDSDTSVEENDNMFHASYRKTKENPLYSSNPDLPRSPAKPAEAPPSHSDSTVDDEDDVPTRRPRQQRPIYSEV